MKILARSHIAIILVVIYSLIIVSPLASRIMNSTTAAQALSGECTGDCRTCGCSSESMATGTCCCMKKRQQAHAHEDDHDGRPECDQKTPDRKQTVIVSCGCLSGNGEHVTLSGSGASELLPCYFSARFSIPCTVTCFPFRIERLVSFQGEPPDPPPKIILRS